jgi:hypothetical protein
MPMVISMLMWFGIARIDSFQHGEKFRPAYTARRRKTYLKQLMLICKAGTLLFGSTTRVYSIYTTEGKRVGTTKMHLPNRTQRVKRHY